MVTLEFRNTILALAKEYTEEELSIQYNKPIAEIRQLLKGPLPMTSAAWAEAINLYPEANNNTLAKLYNTSFYQIKKWATGQGKDVVKLSEFEIAELVKNCKTLKEASELTGLSAIKLKSYSEYLAKEKRHSMPDIELLKAIPGTHEDIALRLGVSRSWVTRQLSNKTKKSTPNKVKDWDAVLEYLKANSLSATAKKFNITPSAIIHWKQRNLK